MIRAIRIRLYPTPDQKKYLAGLFGAVRFCFNKALYLKTHFYKVKGVNLHPIHDLKKLIAIAKNTKKYAWLAEYDCMALQESVRNLNKAYSRFFKKGERQKFCVHGIIGARQTGASNEHEHQTQFS